MQIDHAIVAVYVDSCGEEDCKQDNGGDANEKQGKEHEAAEMTAAASFEAEPALRAAPDRVGDVGFAFRTFKEGHGHDSWTPANSSKYWHDSHSSSTYWNEIPSIMPSTIQQGWPVGFIFLKHSSQVVAFWGLWFFQ